MTYIVLKVPLNSNQPTNPRKNVRVQKEWNTFKRRVPLLTSKDISLLVMRGTELCMKLYVTWQWNLASEESSDVTIVIFPFDFVCL